MSNKTTNDSGSELDEILYEYTITHTGNSHNAQCRCIEGAKGHLRAKLQAHIDRKVLEAEKRGYMKGRRAKRSKCNWCGKALICDLNYHADCIEKKYKVDFPNERAGIKAPDGREEEEKHAD